MRVLLLLALAATLRGGEIRGTVVVGPAQEAAPGVQVVARLRGGPEAPAAVSGMDGVYRMRDLAPGTYDLQVTSPGYYRARIREVRVDGPDPVVVPALRLEVGLMADCGTQRRPEFYRPSGGGAATGAVGGEVRSEKGMPVAGALVKLFRKGAGLVAERTTRADGGFTFEEVMPSWGEDWFVIEAKGHFTEEVERLRVLQGLEAVYSTIALESCQPGRCQPHLKTPKVVGHCE